MERKEPGLREGKGKRWKGKNSKGKDVTVEMAREGNCKRGGLIEIRG